MDTRRDDFIFEFVRVAGVVVAVDKIFGSRTLHELLFGLRGNERGGAKNFPRGAPDRIFRGDNKFVDKILAGVSYELRRHVGSFVERNLADNFLHFLFDSSNFFCAVERFKI